MLYWIDHVWSSEECVCCGPSERLGAPSICFVCGFSMSEVISSFRSLRAGSQVSAPLMLFLCVIVHTMPATAMHLALWYIVLVCHQYDVCENSVGNVYIGGYGGLSEVYSVVCLCQLFCSAWMCCLEEVYRCLKL